MAAVTHFEIPADDVERARQFYRAAFDWRLDAMPDMQYTNVVTTPVDDATQAPLESGAINGGMFLREDDLVHPIITVDVDDIDRALEGDRRGRWRGGACSRGDPGHGVLRLLPRPRGQRPRVVDDRRRRRGGGVIAR